MVGRRIARHWPLWAAILVLWVVVAAFLIERTPGPFVYTLDDAYIHIAMAKNLARHGVFGVTRYAFSSTSSSLLWTLLLAAWYGVFGVHDLVPLILNIVFATLLLVFLYAMFFERVGHRLWAFIFLLVVLWAAPLPMLIFMGMEHVLQALVVIVFVYQSAKNIVALSEGERIKAVWWAFGAVLVAAVRYEGLFVVLAVCCLLLAHKKWPAAIGLGVVSALPALVYGQVSVAHGAFWLPNSILLKGSMPRQNALNFLRYPLISLGVFPSIWLMLLASIEGLALTGEKVIALSKRQMILLIVFVAVSLLHIFSVTPGMFYRYEAYLVVMGCCAVSAFLPQLAVKWNRRLTKILLPAVSRNLVLFLLGVSLIHRAGSALLDISPARKNIYEQQYQVGRFLRQFYQGQTVAANDIGAINYLADIRCLDVFGLGSIDVARMKRARQYTLERVYAWARFKGARIAVVYHDLDELGAGGAVWEKVGQWTIADNVVCGSDTVFFYAAGEGETARLAANLRAFAPRLPVDVAQQGVYVNAVP